MACSITLNGLATDCGANVGGVKNVLIAPYSANTFSLAGEATGKIHCYTLTANTQTWKVFYFRKNTASATSTLNVDQTNGTNYVSTELALTFAKMDSAKRLEMEALCKGDVAVVYKDCNGKWWAMGVDGPVTASAAGGQTGTAKTDGNNYTITLTSEDKTFPYELNNVSSAAADTHLKQFSSTQYTNAGEWPGGSPINDNPATQPIGG